MLLNFHSNWNLKRNECIPGVGLDGGCNLIRLLRTKVMVCIASGE